MRRFSHFLLVLPIPFLICVLSSRNKRSPCTCLFYVSNLQIFVAMYVSTSVLLIFSAGLENKRTKFLSPCFSFPFILFQWLVCLICFLVPHQVFYHLNSLLSVIKGTTTNAQWHKCSVYLIENFRLFTATWSLIFKCLRHLRYLFSNSPNHI